MLAAVAPLRRLLLAPWALGGGVDLLLRRLLWRRCGRCVMA